MKTSQPVGNLGLEGLARREAMGDVGLATGQNEDVGRI